ncbi:MAG: two-component regulator propeller domain-containing protein, partial [Bacteroidales bacterium]
MVAILLLLSRYISKGASLFLILGLLFSSSIAFSQPENWDITYFSTEDGLSSNHVNVVMKDSKGFIWVGTENGLNKFDGYTFSSLKLPSGANHPLSRLKVLTIFEDRDSILWIGTSDGLFRYNPSEPLAQIRHFQYINKPDSLTYRFSQPISKICEDKKGLFWVLTMDGDDAFGYELYCFDRQTETFELIYIDSRFFSHAGDNESLYGWLYTAYSDSNGDLWFGSNRGLLKYNFEQKSFKLHVPFPESQAPEINHVMTIHEDNQGNFWISNSYGMSLLDRKTMTFQKYIPLQSKFWMGYGYQSDIYSIGEDQNGILWIRVNHSLLRIMPKRGGAFDFESCQSWEPEYTTSARNPMASLMVESPAMVWLGIPDQGLCRVTVRRNAFTTIKPTSLYRSGEIDLDYINSLYIDREDHLWYSWIDPGVFQYEAARHEAAFYDVVPGRFIHGIETDEFGNMCFATRVAYASRAMPAKNGKMEFVVYMPNEEDPASISRRTETYVRNIGGNLLSQHIFEHLLYKDRYGTLWFNSGKGIHDRYDPVNDGFIHLDHRVTDFFNNDTCVEAEVDGELWFPTAEGLLRLLPPFTKSEPFTLTSGSAILYRNQPDDEASLSADWIRTICFSRQYEPGTLWIGTIGGGLNRLVKTPVVGTDRVEVHFEHYTVEDGLCDNNVLGIIEDEQGHLWLSTMNGLSRFDTHSGIFNNFYKKDGLPTNHFSWADPYKNSSGELFFPTEAGVLTFQPEKIQINSVEPPVVITDFRIFNEPVYPGKESPLKQDISYATSAELKYNQNFLSFEYAALDYEQPERNHYKYILEGYDRDWVLAGTRRYVEYKGLRPGHYTFRVQGSNYSGIWNEEGATFELDIQNPPWLRWWAWTLYLILMTNIILWYRGILVKRERLKTAVEIERLEKDKIREIDSFRSRFFTNISHEFRTPLTLLIGPLEDSLKKGRENEGIGRKVRTIMLRNARRLERLINQLLDISKLESGMMKLHPARGKLSDLVRTVASSFLSLAESRGIQFTMNIEQETATSCFDADKMEKIITNLLSNAFKFCSTRGTVSLGLEYRLSDDVENRTTAVLTVKDTGKGMEKEQLERIFDRFYQVSDTDTREAEGSGIGLALTKELVELMHGKIEVESEPGLGSLFRLTFPVSEAYYREQGAEITEMVGNMNDEPGLLGFASEADEEIGEDKKTSETKITGTDKRSGKELILVVEDNPDLRTYIIEQFRTQYRVIEAGNGEEGMERSIAHIPDLVITDLMMPVMGGMEFCRKLREHPATNHIPVIMLTAKADKESMLEGLEAAADDYIIKPFDSELLLVR